MEMVSLHIWTASSPQLECELEWVLFNSRHWSVFLLACVVFLLF